MNAFHYTEKYLKLIVNFNYNSNIFSILLSFYYRKNSTQLFCKVYIICISYIYLCTSFHAYVKCRVTII